ncbi:MAG TPA: hypothetical protein VJU83_06130 [Burkholderiales bacterium]|nr:hypothetical protein [Burkholderiales bacterium]
MRRTLVMLVALLPVIALAGFPFQATLKEMAEGSDHILIGRVTGVDMIDSRGEEIADRQARTGPGLSNTIRLIITVDQVLITNSPSVPKVLRVPLASHLHYSLGQIQDAHAGDTLVRLVLLKGRDFVGIKPGVFLRPLEDKDEALRLYAASHS